MVARKRSTGIDVEVDSQRSAFRTGGTALRRKRIQPRSIVIRGFYEAARDRLKYPLLTFDEAAREVIARAIEQTIRMMGYTCYACAVMPDHVHILIRKHKHLAEEMIRNLQRETHIALRDSGLRDEEHPVWGGCGWKVFLDEPEDVWRTIDYVEGNPGKMRLPEQKHSFVVPYDDWPFHRRSRARRGRQDARPACGFAHQNAEIARVDLRNRKRLRARSLDVVR
jgi:REP element-mobilizing transposase RayT